MAGKRAAQPKRRLLQLLDEKFPGYHPVVEMAKMANDMNNPVELRFAANREVARYVEPQLSAVKVVTGGESGRGVLLVPAVSGSLENWAAQAAAVNRHTERTVIEHTKSEPA